MSGRLRIPVAIAGLVLVLAAVLASSGPAIARTMLGSIISAATGYDVRFGSVQLGWSHAALRDVHVGKNGDPVLDADRVDVDYALRDIFPGGKHRYGFSAIAVQHPVITLVRHADGAYNLNRFGTSPTPPSTTKRVLTPFLFTARVRDGVLRLIDRAPLQADLGEQTIVDLSVDASVQSNVRTVARMDGTLVGRRAQSAPLARWPLREQTTIDDEKGYAVHRFRSGALPLRGILNFLIHAPVARFDDGVLRDVDVLAYAVDVAADTPVAYRLGGGARLDGARIRLGPLAKPVRDLSGRLNLFDDGVAAPHLSATVAGVPIVLQGALYDFAQLNIRLGIAGDPALAKLRTLFTFLENKPVSGPSHLETLVTARVEKPLIRTSLSSPGVVYDRYPLRRIDGVVDYADNVVSFNTFRTRFSSFDAVADGLVDVSRRDPTIEAQLRVLGPAAALPYADRIIPDEELRASAVLGGTGETGFHVRGTLESFGTRGTGAGFIAVDEKGVGEFGPFIFERSDGAVIAGGFRLERTSGESAGWIAAEHYPLTVPLRAAVLPGVKLPAFPPVGGVVDVALVAGGHPSDFSLAGHFHATGGRYEKYALGTVDGDLAGNFEALQLRDVAVDGPAGRFTGGGAVAGGAFALTGTYDGSLEQLEPFTGEIGGRGRVRAPVAAFIGDAGIVVQTSAPAQGSAVVRGVAFTAPDGTLAVKPTGLRVVAAEARVGGAPLVATAHQDDDVAVSSVGVSARAFNAIGVPLDAGSISLFGLADLHGPRFRGVVDLAGGSARGFPIRGWAEVAAAGNDLSVLDGVGALGTTYARFAGRVAAIGTPAFSYHVDAEVPLGDVAGVVHDFGVPLRYAEGSFRAQLQVFGSNGLPSINGTFAANEGSYNGLAFRDASGRFTLDLPRLAIDAGRVTIGQSNLRFAAAVGAHSLALSAAGSDLDLSDFNGYFDEGGMLDGRGSADLVFRNDGRLTTTSGRVDLAGARVRHFPLGSVNGTWRTVGGRIAADLHVAGPAATSLAATGTFEPARGGPRTALLHGAVDADVHMRGFDLGTWLPAAGMSALPLLGRLDADEHITGTYPRLGAAGSATLRNGVVGPYAIVSATARTSVANGRLVVDSAQADVGFAQFTATGTAGLSATEPLDLDVRSTVPDLAVAVRRVPQLRAFDIGGRLEADLRVGGTLRAPRLRVGFDAEGARYRHFTVPSVTGELDTDLHAVNLQGITMTLPHGTAVAAGTLPITLHPAGVGPAAAPISLQLEARAVDVAPFAELFPTPGTVLAGQLDGLVVVQGTVGAPRIVGDLALQKGSYVSKLETDPIRNVLGKVHFAGTSVALEAFHADVGGGTIDAAGRLDLPLANAPPSAYTVDVRARRAHLTFPDYGGGQLDGTATLSSGRRIPVLSGNVTLSNASIPFAAVFRAAGGGAESESGGFNIGFDLAAHVGPNVRIRSPIIDVGVAGGLDLTGTLRTPRLAGVLAATRGGIFSTYQRTFRIQEATVTFDPTQGVVPALDLRATAHVSNPDPDPNRNAIGSADITVSVTGPADSYQITYASDPPYSQAQILGLLVDAPLLGAVNFDTPQAPGSLRGAPGESNVLLPPGVTPYQTGVYTFQQEAFSILNAQVAQRILSPIENAFGGALGLTDLQLTLDLGGRVGYVAQQVISRRHDVSVNFGQVLSYPTRTSFGFEAHPDAITRMTFSYFDQNGAASYANTLFGTLANGNVRVLNGVQPLSNRQGFRFNVIRTYP